MIRTFRKYFMDAFMQNHYEGLRLFYGMRHSQALKHTIARYAEIGV